MAMTVQLKEELTQTQVIKTCCRKAEVSAFLRIADALDVVDGALVIEAEIPSAVIAQRIKAHIGAVFGQDTAVSLLRGTRRGDGEYYVLRVSDDAQSLARQTGLVDRRNRPVRGMPPQVVAGGDCDALAAWRGALLARGALTEPGRSRALEVITPGPEAGLALVGSARRLGVASRSRQVRGQDRVIIKDTDAIADVLTQLGAPKTLAAWLERQKRREVRKTTHRLANFDDANLRRSLRAAITAGARVRRAFEILGDEIPDHLRYAGQLRLEHERCSLEELGQRHDPPLTKDAIAGRIRRLLAMADQAASEQQIPDTEAGVTEELFRDT